MVKSWTSVKNLEEMEKLFDPEFVHNKKIECIKSLRTISSSGLKEAKDFFEEVIFPAIPVPNGDSKEMMEKLRKSSIETRSLRDIVKDLNDRLTVLEKAHEQKRNQTSRQVAKGLFGEQNDD